MLDSITYSGTVYYRYNLDNVMVDKLRAMVRHFKVERNSSSPTGIEISGMGKTACIDWLLQSERSESSPLPLKSEYEIDLEKAELAEKRAAMVAVSEIQSEANPSPFAPFKPNGQHQSKAEQSESPSPFPSDDANDDVANDLRRVFGKLGLSSGRVSKEDVAAAVSEAVAATESRLREEFSELIRKSAVRIEIKGPSPEAPLRDIGRQHSAFPEILILAEERINTALVGPAGSGKTFTAHQVAKALNLPFEAISVGPQTSQSNIMGYMDASGKYVSTAFRRIYEHGGIILFDEFDAANPGVATCINGATANAGAGFPDGYVLRHPDCIVIIAMNTWGKGASVAYVGRQQQDAATMNRFAFVPFDYDEELEDSLCPDKQWVQWVQRARASLFKLGNGPSGVRHVISPRATFMGAKMLARGLKREFVENAVVWQGLAKTEVAKILAGMA